MPRLLLAAGLVFLAAALVLSVVAAWSHDSQALFGCGEGGMCGAVMNGRWSFWLGVPVVLLGVAVYLLVFVAVSFLAVRPQSALGRRIVVTGLVTMVTAAIWFTGIQAGGAGWCAHCLVIHAFAILAAAAILPWLSGAVSPADVRNPIRPGGLLGSGALGLGATGVLALGQILAPPRDYSVVHFDAMDATRHEALLAAADGRGLLLVGESSAPYRIYFYFDYGCGRCHRLYPNLLQVENEYRGQLAVVLIPFPLDARCNPQFEDYSENPVSPCERTRLSLALWTLDPDKFLTFHNFQMRPPLMFRRLPTASARLMAEKLAGGGDRLRQAMNDPRIDKMISSYCRTYGNFKELRSVPMIVIGNQIVRGYVSAGDLAQLVEQVFQIKARTVDPVSKDSQLADS